LSSFLPSNAFLSSFLPLFPSFCCLAPAVGDLRNGAAGELDSRLFNCLPSFFLSYFLSFFPSFCCLAPAVAVVICGTALEMNWTPVSAIAVLLPFFLTSFLSFPLSVVRQPRPLAICETALEMNWTPVASLSSLLPSPPLYLPPLYLPPLYLSPSSLSTPATGCCATGRKPVFSLAADKPTLLKRNSQVVLFAMVEGEVAPMCLSDPDVLKWPRCS
jgi:hypothetical protein